MQLYGPTSTRLLGMTKIMPKSPNYSCVSGKTLARYMSRHSVLKIHTHSIKHFYKILIHSFVKQLISKSVSIMASQKLCMHTITFKTGNRLFNKFSTALVYQECINALSDPKVQESED